MLKGTEERPIPVPPVPRTEDVKPAESVPPVPTVPGLSYGGASIVVNRLARLVPDRASGWMLARFESDNTLQQPPLRLLPCKVLERAERMTARAPAKMVKFRVSGVITQYKGHRYLLLRKGVLEREMGQF